MPNFNFDWISFSWGIAAGIIIFNLFNLLTAYMRLKRSKRRMVDVNKRLEDAKRDLEKRKQELQERIKAAMEETRENIEKSDKKENE